MTGVRAEELESTNAIRNLETKRLLISERAAVCAGGHNRM
jgi:hypothetical protein